MALELEASEAEAEVVTYDPPPVPVGYALEEYNPVFVSDAVSDGPLLDDDNPVFVSDAVSDGPPLDDDNVVDSTLLVEEIVALVVPAAEPEYGSSVGVALAEDGGPVDDVGLPEDVEDVGVDPAVP